MAGGAAGGTVGGDLVALEHAHERLRSALAALERIEAVRAPGAPVVGDAVASQALDAVSDGWDRTRATLEGRVRTLAAYVDAGTTALRQADGGAVVRGHRP